MGARLRRATATEVTQPGVDPALWARITGYWAETTEGNRAHPLEGYTPVTLIRRDFATLKEGEKLTGDIISEVGHRIANSAPQVAFLDPTFLYKVAPTNGEGGRCTSRFWTGMVGKAPSQNSAPQRRWPSRRTASRITGAVPPWISTARNLRTTTHSMMVRTGSEHLARWART